MIKQKESNVTTSRGAEAPTTPKTTKQIPQSNIYPGGSYFPMRGDQALSLRALDSQLSEGPKGQPRPCFRRGVKYSRDKVPLLSTPLHSPKISEKHQVHVSVSDQQSQEALDPVDEERRRRRDLISRLHRHTTTPTDIDECARNFFDHEEMYRKHSENVENALADMLQRHPCMKRDWYCPSVLHKGPGKNGPLRIRHDTQSQWFSESIENVTTKFWGGDIALCAVDDATPCIEFAPDNYEESGSRGTSSTSFEEEAVASVPVSPTSLNSPLFFSPPLQRVTTTWTIQTEMSWSDEGTPKDEMTPSTPATDTTGSDMIGIGALRVRSRGNTVDSITRLMRQKQDLEEQQEKAVNVETLGIKVMQAIHERYQTEGKDWAGGEVVGGTEGLATEIPLTVCADECTDQPIALDIVEDEDVKEEKFPEIQNVFFPELAVEGQVQPQHGKENTALQGIEPDAGAVFLDEKGMPVIPDDIAIALNRLQKRDNTCWHMLADEQI
ncbi:hypothetical protein BJ878DRAFT_546229 [Calycina marina]|uniref:Uncharacterized protein n=1 Tax=Calycina marina TaxID=1763456 RepID=A0A9P8CBD2_9HELO|nr:hypothetical protein BJ878DRAFT_546229 [Calycina marina]